MEQSRISIVMPMRNASRTIGRCLDSILSQGWDFFELLCVDNGSTDQSASIVRSYMAIDQRIRLISEPIVSRGAARHRGVAEAAGEIIAGLDADCVAGKDWLKNITEPIRSGQASITMGGETDAIANYWTRETQLANDAFIRAHLSADGSQIDFFDSKNFAADAALLKRIGFDAAIGNCEDYEFKLRLSKHAAIRFVPDAQAAHYHRDGSISLSRTFFDRGWWIAKIVQQDAALIEPGDRVAESVSLGNMLLFVPWLLLRLLRLPPSKWAYLALTQISWRCGIIAFWFSDQGGVRPWWERILFKIKIGRFHWGSLRIQVYRLANRRHLRRSLPPAVISFAAKSIAYDPIKLISVVVATRNRLKTLQDCVLLGLLNQDACPAELEIIIVDDGSTDGTGRYLQSIVSEKIKIAQQSAMGASAARNRGISLARGQVVALLDDDCLPDRGWLGRVYNGYQGAKTLFGQGAIYDRAYQTVLNILPTEDPEDSYFGQFYEGNMSFRRDIFKFASFNPVMTYGKEGWDLVSQIDFYFPGARRYYDGKPIEHFRAAAEYRNEGSRELTAQMQKKERTLYWLWQINQASRRRNAAALPEFFALRFWIRELTMLPLELLFLPRDLPLLIESKLFIYSQLLSLSVRFRRATSDSKQHTA